MTNAANRPGEGRVRTVRLPAERASVPLARRTIVEDLQARGIDPQIVDEAEIVVSELVANALRHARPLSDGTVRVHWKVKDGLVEVEVTDGGGTTTPQPLPRSTWTPAGRGLRIVRSIAHEWGVVDDKQGCTVWAALGGPSRRRA
ncbi:MAG TPA: ATP-binding protein [Segeticoccus sp.]|uniref:ATP-binding protein n=1 Tax=Segeticoccus sp. TaxID=2706531 RepID=UPI002D802450|nr:ATP-binding protein [Segeticoccus sp.]HET8601965.1 ATP-binding protein [Segeticoccus sp.]